jgi:hypothetical protein
MTLALRCAFCHAPGSAELMLRIRMCFVVVQLAFIQLVAA